MDYSRPIFILGNPRSGTTLLRLMMNCHSEIVVPPESGFLQWWFDKYKDWNKESCSNDHSIEAWIQDLASSKKIETWNLDFGKIKSIIKKERPENYADLNSLVYASYGNGNESRWGDKNNYYIDHIPLLQDLYPEAQFIHLIRDGRDVACSYKAMPEQSGGRQYAPKLPQEIKLIATEWVNKNYKILSSFKRGKESSKKYLGIKYESLVLQTIETLKEICDFIELPYDSEMQNYHQEKAENKIEPEALISWKQKTKQKPDIHNIGKYKKILSPTDIMTFNQSAENLLNQFGYAL